MIGYAHPPTGGGLDDAVSPVWKLCTVPFTRWAGLLRQRERAPHCGLIHAGPGRRRLWSEQLRWLLRRSGQVCPGSDRGQVRAQGRALPGMHRGEDLLGWQVRQEGIVRPGQLLGRLLSGEPVHGRQLQLCLWRGGQCLRHLRIRQELYRWHLQGEHRLLAFQLQRLLQGQCVSAGQKRQRLRKRRHRLLHVRPRQELRGRDLQGRDHLLVGQL
jgi:hypothetical protein